MYIQNIVLLQLST